MDPENVGTEAIVRVTHWLRGIWEMRRRGGPVQQWVDSIPAYGSATTTTTTTSSSSSSFVNKNLGESSQRMRSELQTEGKSSSAKDNNSSSILREKLLRKTDDMTASAPISIPNSPTITMTCPASSVPHNRLARDPSFQSDSSHCSSVESLLEWRKADPEAILLGLGFGYPSSPQENGTMARIPRRFLQPSKLKGIAVDEFLKQQQESNESLDSASLGYRGLTGSPYVAPSEIVQKIMERLREHESHEIDSYTNTNSSSELFGSMQQDGRLSVLSPDNRQYLERPRSKSPDMRNKRMIIGAKSFAFGYNGDLIEIDSLNKKAESFDDNLNSYEYNPSDSSMNSDPQVQVSASAPSPQLEENGNSKSVKTSGRRLAKQLSFDDDSSSYDSRDTLDTLHRVEDLPLPDQRLSEEQRDSLITVVSKWSESVESANEKCGPISHEVVEDTGSNLIARRASDGLCDLKLKKNSLTPSEERRMSDGGIESKVQRLSESGGLGERRKISWDKKPGLKRQARVSEPDAMDCGDVEKSGEELSPVLSTGFDKIDDYISEDKTLRDCDSRIFKTRTIVDGEDNEVGEHGKELSSSDEMEKCCQNDELDQICEHEETSTDCCCHPSSSNCWKKMSKIMKKNQKLENMVAKSKQEMAELREMLNSVMSVRTEPGF